MADAPITIRLSQDGDLDDVVAAYNAGIAERVATFETDPRAPEDIAHCLTDGQPAS